MVWGILASIVGIFVIIYGIFTILGMIFTWCVKHAKGLITFFSAITFMCLGSVALVLEGWEALGVVTLIAFFALVFALLRGRKQ